MAGAVIDRRQLARKLGRSVDWTYRTLYQLHPAFPPQVLPGSWYEPAVDAYLMRWSQGGTAPTTPAPAMPAPPADEISAAEARMLDRLGAAE